MRTLTLLIGLSLALAGGTLAQQVEEQASPSGKKGKAEETTPNEKPIREKAHGAKTETNAANPEATTGQQHGPRGEHGVKSETLNAPATSPATGTSPAEEIGKKGHHGRNAEATKTTTAETGTTASPGATQGPERGGKGKHDRNADQVKTETLPATGVSPATGAKAGMGRNGKQIAATEGVVGKGGKKVEAQQLQQIKQQHTSFRAQPRPDKAPPVQFSANFRIANADRWQGPQYEVFRSYHPERHDRNWYHSRYHRVELIGGGWYYWNSGYWYPAWGYDSSSEYYAYNGPIYVGQRAEPPDQVIADVQAELQEMGYYQGEVDGLLGPLTQQALADYQGEHNLDQTAAIDEPTLDSLGMS